MVDSFKINGVSILIKKLLKILLSAVARYGVFAAKFLTTQQQFLIRIFDNVASCEVLTKKF